MDYHFDSLQFPHFKPTNVIVAVPFCHLGVKPKIPHLTLARKRQWFLQTLEENTRIRTTNVHIVSSKL